MCSACVNAKLTYFFKPVSDDIIAAVKFNSAKEFNCSM